ncbi:phosphonate C-P lyase system protein PhnL [Rhodanobacter sp. MP1X3]|jgi:alpha-D-ribose 1-methylphosphonate 5-triphosphate synthase subunit PhnL|uniref:phosphonate C-P lyase system protein PhnL n=1 Tax=Rhodanobacter sp. MP1X3 TaxID=2723086 RepID=UPI0017B57442|nr:phosphonate C-P lyase system protein PhnL [Rhodanobacter sp. MP1X3]MBB6240754.1 alpha-D-ribose 1-methylphosphonate 5-triphosphate synthase subunit PhnL [Rhodanobacter sp. MP1X3]
MTASAMTASAIAAPLVTAFASPMLELRGLGKSFELHHQHGARLDVLDDVELTLHAGECVVLSGPSGAGKSSLLRVIYANYRPSRGAVRVRHDGDWLDLAEATPHQVLEVRRRTLGYVSQFLRVIPRVPALDIVAEPLIEAGLSMPEARQRAGALLHRLNVPERLWRLPPGTFSGGEQQRVNIARGLIVSRPLLLLDEPTASLDADNRSVVAELLEEARVAGSAVLGIFHDEDMRDRVATRLFPMHPLQIA